MMADGNALPRLFSGPSFSKVLYGLNGTFNNLYWLKSLKISHCNGDDEMSFSQASCTIDKNLELFPLPTFFHSTVKKIIEIDMAEDSEDNFSGEERELFQNLFTVIGQSQDIAKKLLNLYDKKETAYAVQLAHHVLIPLSLHKKYKMDKHSRSPITKCACCDEEITGTFSDTSMGNEKVWHGSTDILIGQKDKVAVHVVDDDEDDDNDDDDDDEAEETTEEEDYYCPTPSFEIKGTANLDACRNQFIAETIVFGFLHLKMNPSGKTLVPTIVISKKELKLYFYDAHHDILLESANLPLFTPNGDDLRIPTIVALWLAINYHITCSGLTRKMKKTALKTGFMNNFSEEVKEKYRKDLRFGDCRKKTFSTCEEVYSSGRYDYKRMFDEPSDDSLGYFTERHYDHLVNEAANMAI